MLYNLLAYMHQYMPLVVVVISLVLSPDGPPGGSGG